jgi:hypothetical protein
METAERKSRLRLVRIAGDSVLREKVLPKKRLNKDTIDVIRLQMKGIIEEMEAEWENDPGSDELREGFHLLSHYVRCLEKYAGNSRSNVGNAPDPDVPG